ncbi:hypothetical protein DY000_02022445 [Brassica cretica]|uniref:Uncharacterized protein n=1 Tax=Brassica cretica TaxID=69181 RepID=A0ABQ7EHF4_BRACR|nr:hypothetical protein DY000_02022445 [Brassica cretica]
MHIYSSCGLWKFDPLKGWGFAVDKNKRGRALYMKLTSSFEDLRRMAFENFGIDQNLFELELCVSTSPISGNNGNIGDDNEKSNSPFREQEYDVLAISAKLDDNGKSVRFSLMDVVKRENFGTSDALTTIANGVFGLRGYQNPDHQENLERTRDGTSCNGRVLRRDASDRDRMVWRLVMDVRRGRRTRLLHEFASRLIGNSSWL